MHQLRLLDVENNKLSDDYVPSGLEVLNTRFNKLTVTIDPQVYLNVKVLNPASVRAYSRFEKFGDFAFGEPS